MAVTAAQVQKDRRIANQPRRGNKKTESLAGDFTTTTSGTLSTTAFTSVADAGFLLTKTAGKTGRYTVQVWEGYKRLRSCVVTLTGTDDAALTDAKGANYRLRAIDIGLNNKDGTFEIQFIKNTDSSDAEVQDGAIIKIALELEF